MNNKQENKIMAMNVIFDSFLFFTFTISGQIRNQS